MTLTHAIRRASPIHGAPKHGTKADCDGEDGTRQLPRLRIVDDRGSPLARARARFVSGYLTFPRVRAPKISAAAGPTHGARSICRAPVGRIRSTNGIIGNRDLIRVAVARDPNQAIPLSGTYAGSPDDDLGNEKCKSMSSVRRWRGFDGRERS